MTTSCTAARAVRTSSSATTGNDVINSGGGGIPAPTHACATLPSTVLVGAAHDLVQGRLNGGTGFDTVTYADRVGRDRGGPWPKRRGDRLTMTARVERHPAMPPRRSMGGLAADELVGGLGPDTFNGGPGNAPDTICGGLGNDTVDYSDKPDAVTVTLDGVLADRSGHHRHRLGAVHRSAPGLPPHDQEERGGTPGANGYPCVLPDTPGGPGSYVQHASCRKDPTGPDPGEPEMRRDCTPNDGVQGENDCVGEDIENIIGSAARRRADRQRPRPDLRPGPAGRAVGRERPHRRRRQRPARRRLGAGRLRGRRRRRHGLVRGSRGERSLPRSTARQTTGLPATGIWRTTRATRSWPTSRI